MTSQTDSMQIALIGYRGTGKSTVGWILAQRLDWSFVDTDEEVERRAGRSIAAIFAADGEPAFRDLESAVVRDLASRDRAVLALGGGVVLRPENRAALTTSTVVWLAARPETIHARLAADPTTAGRRPALTNAGGLEEVRALVAARQDLYRQSAQLVVDTEEKDPAAIATEILHRLGFGYDDSLAPRAT